MRLAGSRILITGAARGLGRRFALDLASAGARVGGCDLDPAGLASLEEETRNLGTPIWTRQADVADETEVEALFADFVAHFDGIEAVVKLPAKTWHLLAGLNTALIHAYIYLCITMYPYVFRHIDLCGDKRRLPFELVADVIGCAESCALQMQPLLRVYGRGKFVP